MCQYNQTTSNPCFSSGTVEQMKYSKLSLVSPGLGWHVFLSGSKSADKWRGSYGGLLNKQERRSASKQTIISADQNTVCIYWFLIKLQNFIMNWIHFNSFGGGWQSDVFVCLFVCLFRGIQRLFSVKYLFGEANIAWNFLLLEDG